MADSMLVNTILMLVYVTKFFWWEAGYWNTMDIAHDRGSYIFFPVFLISRAYFFFYYFVIRRKEIHACEGEI